MSDSDVEVITMPVPIPNNVRTPPTTPAKEVKDLEMVSPSPSPAKVSDNTPPVSIEEKENSIVQELMGDMTRHILAVEGERAAKEGRENSISPAVCSTANTSDNHLVIDLDDDDDIDIESIKENIENSANAALHATPRIQEDVKKILRKLTRDEMEEIVTGKIIECVNAHSAIGVLRTKVARLTVNKDRIFQKATSLQKQVAELSKSMRQITENNARNPKINEKAYIPLKFFRSVGLQVNTDQLPKLNHARSVPQGAIMRAPIIQPQPASSVPSKPSTLSQKHGATTNSIGTPTGQHNNTSGVVHLTNGPAGPGQKRAIRPTISVNDVRSQIQVPPAKIPRRMGPGSSPVRGNSSSPARFPVQAQQVRGTAPGTIITSLNSPQSNGGLRLSTPTTTNTIIDLTDDSKPTSPTTVNIVNQNGVQYRVVNQGGIPQGMQLVQSPSHGVFRLVGPQGQSRPVVFQQQQSQVRPPVPQQPSRQSSPINPQFILRTISPSGAGIVRSNSVANNIQKPRPTMVPNRTPAPVSAQSTGPRLHSTANPNSQVIIPRNQYNTPASATVPSPTKRFVLPDLPQAAINSQPRRGNKDMPPRPDLTLQEQADGIVLSWTHKLGPNHAEILTYQIYACQEPLINGLGAKPQPAQWKRVGDVKALPLPMACTLSQFTDENRYYFIVRGVDIYNRTGPFCEPANIILKKKH